MKKDIERRCVELTQTAITRFWQCDPEYVLSLCSDDVMWISPDQDRYMRGLDEVSADFRKAVHDIKSSHISHAQFSVAQNCGDACSVAGRYMVTTDEETGVFLQSHERCQFNWERKGGELRIVSIFVSWPRDQRVPDEKCRVDSINKVARRYLEARIAAQSDKRRLVLPDVNGPIRFVSLNEVLWVGVPKAIVRHYTPDGAAKDEALRLMRARRVGTTLFGASDNHPHRLWNMSKLWLHYYLDFLKYFGHRDLEE